MMIRHFGHDTQHSDIPTTLHGFEHISRYWDRQQGRSVAKLFPGEYYVSKYDEMITTVLGSCVSVCVRDPESAIGGMNHFMLPDGDARNSKSWKNTLVSDETRYGNVAMEKLINMILAHGGRRELLEVKVFGGGKVLQLSSDIGGKNVDFVKKYIAEEGFKIASEDVSGIYSRKVQYFPLSGRARIKKLGSMQSQPLIQREINYINTLKHKKVAGSVDIFNHI